MGVRAANATVPRVPRALLSILKRIWHEPLRGRLAVVAIVALAAALRLVALGSLPPGLYRDEAYNGLDALQVLAGNMPLYFPANNGREPLFIYLVALSIGVIGRSPLALRLISALCGVATVPAIYWLGEQLYGQRVALLAALLAATSVWTLNLSRVAFRAALMVPLMTLTLALLWRGLRLRQGRSMAAAGALYGLCFYTYTAVRTSALALALFGVACFVWHRDLVWRRGWALFGVCAFVVIAPLGLYFVGHWDETMGRVAQVSIMNPAISGGEPLSALLRNIWAALTGLVYRGDFIPRHNVPNRPVFGPLMGVAFTVEVAHSILRVRREPAAALILAWLGVMLLPTILAEGALHMLRGAGVLPVLFLFPALSLTALIDWAKSRDKMLAGIVAVTVVLIIGAGSDVTAYARHLRSDAVYYNFEAGATLLAQEVNRFRGVGWRGKEAADEVGLLAREGRTAFIAQRLWENWPSVRYLCPTGDDLGVLGSDNGAVVGGGDVLLVLWPFEDNGDALALLPHGRLITVREGAQERGDLEAESRLLYFTVETSSPDGLLASPVARFEQGIQLVGYRITGMDAGNLAVDLYWHATQPVPVGYTVFVHALQGEQPVGQHDGPAASGYYGTEVWRAGDTIRDHHVLSLDVPLSPETSRVEVGLYRLDTMERLELVDESGQGVGETSVPLRGLSSDNVPELFGKG